MGAQHPGRRTAHGAAPAGYQATGSLTAKFIRRHRKSALGAQKDVNALPGAIVHDFPEALKGGSVVAAAFDRSVGWGHVTVSLHSRRGRGRLVGARR